MATLLVTFHQGISEGGEAIASLGDTRSQTLTVGTASVATDIFAVGPNTYAKAGGYVSVLAQGGDVWVTAGQAPVATVPVAGSGAVSDGFPLLSGEHATFAVQQGDKIAAINLVGAAAAPALTSTGTPGAATVGSLYSFVPTTAGGAGRKRYTLTGTIPPGTSFNSSTGEVSGYPTQAGTFNFGWIVRDASGSVTVTDKSITVAAAAVVGKLTISGNTPADGIVGSAYTFTPVVTGGSGTKVFSRDGNPLPPGWTFSTATGAVANTLPTRGKVIVGDITVRDDTGSETLTVRPITIGTGSEAAPVRLTDPTISVVSGDGLVAGAQIRINHGTYTNSSTPDFYFATNVDFAPSASGPWSPQGIFTDLFTAPTTSITSYIRVREIGINNAGGSGNGAPTNVLGPVASAVLPGPAIPFNSDLQVNAGNVQRGVAFSYPILYGQPDYSIELDPITGFSISGGSNSANALLVGNITASGADDEIVELWFTYKKSGQADRRFKWAVLLSDRAYMPDTANTVSGGLNLDDGSTIQSLNQTAKSSRSLTRTTGAVGQTIFRAALFNDGVGWSGDTGNKYRAELQFGKNFNEGDEFNIAFRDELVGFTQVDLTSPGTNYLIDLQGHKSPTAGADWVPPVWERAVFWSGGVRKIKFGLKWNNENNLKNVDIFVGVTKVLAGSLNVIRFFESDGTTPKKVPVKNGMVVNRNTSNPVSADDPPAGLEIISGGWDGVTDTGVTSVTVSANLTVATRQLLISTNYHVTSSPAIDLPSGWHDWSVRGRYSLTGNGFFEVKMDGVVVYSVTGINFGYKHVGTDKPYFFKAGAYTSPKPGANGFHIIEAPTISSTAIPGLAGRPANPFPPSAVTPLTQPSMARTADGSVGQTYTMVPGVYPSGTTARTYQWVRMTKGTTPATTVITGATGLTYVAQTADVDFYPACRELVNGVVCATAKALIPVFPAPILIDDMSTLTGRTANANSVQTLDAPIQPGIGTLVTARKAGQTAAVIIDKSITGLTVSDFDVYGALMESKRPAVSALSQHYTRDTLTLNAATSIATSQANMGKRWSVATMADLAAGTTIPSGAGTGLSRSRPGDASSARAMVVKTHAFVAKMRGRPRILFYFDDSHISAYEAVKELFDPWGLKATFGLSSDLIKPTIELARSSGKWWQGHNAEAIANGHLLCMDSRDDRPWVKNPIDGTYAFGTTLAALGTEIAAERDRLKAFGLIDSHLQHIVLPNGLYNDDSPRSVSTVTFSTSGGVTTMVTTTAFDAASAVAGADVFGTSVPDNVVIGSVAGDRLSATLAGGVVADGSFTVDIENNTGAFAKRKFVDHMINNYGMKSIRATAGFAPVRTVTRFGGIDPLIPAGSLTNAGFDVCKTYIDDAVKFGTTHAIYTHEVKDTSVIANGLDIAKPELKKIADYLGPMVRDGLIDVVTPLDMIRAEGGASLPF